MNIPSDGFNGDNAALVDSIKSLLALDDRGVLVPNGVCGLARQLLESAAARLKPAAHLTIPGALEWDGDNGTHGVVGAHGADGTHSESAYDDAKDACAEIERAGAPGDVIREMNDELVDLRAQLDESNVVRQLIQAWASAVSYTHLTLPTKA